MRTIVATAVLLLVTSEARAWPAPPPPTIVSEPTGVPGEAYAVTPDLPEAPPSDPELTIDTKGFAGERVSALALSADGRWLAAAGGKEVRLWDLTTGVLRATIRGYKEPSGYKIGQINDVAFSPDGRYLAVGVKDNANVGSTRIYAVDDPTRVHRVIAGHTGCTLGVAFSPDGRYLATYGCDNNMFVSAWRAEDGSARQVRAFRVTKEAGAVEGLPSYFGFPIDGDLLLLRWGEYVFVASISGGTLLDRPRWPPALTGLFAWERSFPHTHFTSPPELGLVGSPWYVRGVEEMLPTNTRSYGVGVWRGNGYRPAAKYKGHRFHVLTMTYRPETGVAASADRFGDVHVWDAATGKPVRVLGSSAQPVYRVAWSAAGNRLEFSTEHYPEGRYDYNHYGPINRSFDLTNRHIGTASWPSDPKSVPRATDSLRRTVTLSATENGGIAFKVAAGTIGRASVAEFGDPSVFAFHGGLGGLGLARDLPFFAGTKEGTLVAGQIDPTAKRPDRDFGTAGFGLKRLAQYLGHTNMITSVSPSPDGRLLATSSLDGTIRIWPLRPPRPAGDVDFTHDGNRVLSVGPGTAAEAAGFRTEDLILTFGDRNFYERIRGIQAGRYRAGDVVDITYLRDGRVTPTRIRLAPTADIIEPLLTIYFDKSREWVAWTPMGHYDASDRGGEFVGWHVNRSRVESADFYPLERFQSVLYRPDVINKVVKTADVKLALKEADSELPAAWPTRRNPPGDLSRRAPFERLRPPAVRFLTPSDGSRTERPAVRVEFEVEETEGSPPRRVVLRNNGRLVTGVETTAAAGKTRRYAADVALEADLSLIEATAENLAGVTASARVKVSRAVSTPPTRRRPRLFVLALGVSKYRDGRLNLRFADRDAVGFAGAWESQKGPMYEEVITKVIVNEGATSQDFRKAMDWLDANADRPGDVAVVLISAHGLFDRAGMWHLATHDTDPESLASTTVSYAEIMRWIDNSLRAHTVLFVDTCFASGVGGAGAKGVARGGAQAFDPWKTGNGTFVLTSCLPNESSYELESRRQGAFTSVVIDALNDRKADVNGDGKLSITELKLYLTQKVPEISKGPQTPSGHIPMGVPELELAVIPGR